MLQERRWEGRLRQVRFEPPRQPRQLPIRVIVAHRRARRFPHLFLRIQLRRRHRQRHDLQPRVGRLHLANGFPPMPRRAVPHQQQPHIRMRLPQLFQVLSGTG